MRPDVLNVLCEEVFKRFTLRIMYQLLTHMNSQRMRTVVHRCVIDHSNKVNFCITKHKLSYKHITAPFNRIAYCEQCGSHRLVHNSNTHTT